MKTTLLTLFLFCMVVTLQNCCKDSDCDCTNALADLVYKAVTASKKADNNGEVHITLNETISFASQVANEFENGDCKDHTATAQKSKLKAVVKILNAAGFVVGTLDTLYTTKELISGAEDNITSKVAFLEEGYYEMDFGLDATNVVPERNEDNIIDVFQKVWALAKVFLGKTESETIKRTETGIAIRVGDGQVNEAKLNEAIQKKDFHAFVRFE